MPDRTRTKTVAHLSEEGVLRVEDGNHGEYRPRRDEFVEDGVAFIRAADIVGNRIDFATADHINEIAFERIRKGVGAPGDVVFSHKGTVGKIAMVQDSAPPYVCSPQTTFWRVLKPTVIDPRYLYFYMQTNDFENQWRAVSGETDMADYVSLTNQRRLKVSFPSITVQQAIASILGALDDKIDLNRRMNETLESLARAIYKSWFVDFDSVVAKAAGKRPFGMDDATAALFPDRFVDSELGPIPEGWRVGAVSDVCLLTRDSVSPSQRPDELFVHFSIPAYDSGTGPIVESGESIKSNKYCVPGDAILLSKLNPETSRVWMPALTGEHTPVCSTEFLVCEAIAPWTRNALYGLFTSLDFQVRFASLVGGTSKSHQRVKPGDFEAMKISQPPAQLLSAFDERTSALFQLQASITEESQTLAQLRDLLLPKLLSGDIRVKDAEKVVEEAV